jgi:RNA polymerase sigma-70 factor, ECF subfamily
MGGPWPVPPMGESRTRNETSPRHGDLEKVLVPHLSAAYDLARWLTRDDQRAEDLAQTACLRAVRFFAGFRGGSARAWLLRIVRNAFYDSLAEARREKRELSLEEETAVGREPVDPSDPEIELLRRADGEVLRRALDQLPAPLREIIVLREIEGLSYREIAEVCDLPPGTVMSRLSRARQAMQELVLRASGGRR